MPVTITGYVSRCGYTAYFFPISTTTSNPVTVTAVPTNPTIEVNGTAVQIQGPYIDTVHTFPFAVYQLSSGSIASIVVQKGGTLYSASTTATATGGSPVGRSFYVTSTAGTGGSGTIGTPWKIGDLLNAATTPKSQGIALTSLQPGDTLFFRAGTYNFTGTAGFEEYQLLSPTTSGTKGQPITLRNFPGETVNIVKTSGGQSVFGSTTPEVDYVRFIGFKVTPGTNDAFHMSGTGCEIGWCEVVGAFLSSSDNHDGIRIDFATDCWVHHCNVHDVTGLPGHNSAGLKTYRSTGLIVEDNWFHGNNANIYDKDSGYNNTYRRNYLTADNGYDAFVGAGQANGPLPLYHVYDNFIDGILNLHQNGTGGQFYNNLIIARTLESSRMDGLTIEGGTSVNHQNFWNNVILSSGTAVWGVLSDDTSNLGPNGTFDYFDYNFYDGTPQYRFGANTYTMATIEGTYLLETHSQQVASATVIYVDTVSYVLKAPYTTAGRVGDPIGPRVVIADILNTARYGPAAAPTVTGAVLGQPVISGGVIQSIPVIYGGWGYTLPPTITIADSTGTLALAVPIMSGAASDDVVTYTAAVNWITTASGNAPAATDAAMGNYAGGFEPGLGGHLDMGLGNPKTTKLGMGLSEHAFATPDGPCAASDNWLHRGGSYIAGTGGGSVATEDIGGQPLTMTGTISTQFDNCAASNQINNFGFPGQIGIWTLVVDDTNPANMMIHGLTGSANAVITPLGTAGLVDPGTPVGPNQIGRVYQWNVQRVANPTSHRLSLSHTVTRSPKTGTFPCTFRNAQIFDPVDTAAALPGYPIRVPLDIPQQVKNWMTMPNGAGPAVLRWGSTNTSGYASPGCDPDDLRNSTDLLWSSGKLHPEYPGWRRIVTINTVRTYACPSSAGFPAWSGVGSITITNGGTGYISPVATATGGSGTGLTLGTPVKNAAGTITSIPVTNQGLNYQTTPPTITITDTGTPPGTGAIAVARPLGGPVTWSSPEVELASWHTLSDYGITSITVNTGGSGYSGTLTAVISGGIGNGLVLGTPTSSLGVITSVPVLVSGTYTVPPAITVTGSTGGSGATFTPVMRINGFPIGTIRVNYGGTGYSLTPTATATGGGGAGCQLGTPVVVGGVIKSIPVINRGTGYNEPPDITITDSTGSGAIAYPNAVTSPVDASYINPLQPGNSRFAGEFLTATDHALKTGQIVFFQTVTSGFYHYTNGPTAAFGSNLAPDSKFICYVTGPRSFAFVQFSSNINTTGAGLPGTINNVTGSYPINATFTIPLPPSSVPFELAAAGSGAFPSCNHWVNIPTAATDEMVREIARRTRDNFPPGRKVYVEWGDENWGFYTLYNYSGPAGKLGAFRNKMVTTTDAAYTDRASIFHNIFVEIFDDPDINGVSNRGGEISRLLGTQGGNSAITNNMVKYTNLYNSGLPEIPILLNCFANAPYYYLIYPSTLTATSIIYPFASLISDVSTSKAYLWPTPWTRAGIFDYWRHHIVYSPQYNSWYGLGNTHNSIIDNYIPPLGFPFEPLFQVGYEGGIQAFTPSEEMPLDTTATYHRRVSTDMYYDPEAVHCFRAIYQQVQQGLILEWANFSIGSPFLLQGHNYIWPFQTSAGQPAGHGDGTATTTTGFVPEGTPVTNKFVGNGTTTYHEQNVNVFMQAWRDIAEVSNALTNSFASGSVTLARLNVAGSATVTADVVSDGHGTISLVRVTVAGVGRFTDTATGPITLTRLTVAGVATFTPKIFDGHGAITLTSLTVAGVGRLTDNGTGAITLGSLVASGSATVTVLVPVNATGAITLAALTVAGVGRFSGVATGPITLGALVVSGVASVLIPPSDAHGAITLGSLGVASVGRFTSLCIGDVSLEPLLAAGIADVGGASVVDSFGDIMLAALIADGVAVFTLDPPTISGIAPTEGTEIGGTPIVIVGTGFSEATTVMFGPFPATSFDVLEDILATAISPAGTDTVHVTIETPLGVSAETPLDQFTYIPVDLSIHGDGFITLAPLAVNSYAVATSALLVWVDPRNARLANVATSFLVTVEQTGQMVWNEVLSIGSPPRKPPSTKP